MSSLEEPVLVQNRIIHALDVSTIGEAIQMVEELEAWVGHYKIGLEFQTSTLTQIMFAPNDHMAVATVQDLRALGRYIRPDRLMWDGKFHDISETMGKAVQGLRSCAPKFFTVHASAGKIALERVAKEQGSSTALAVTVLTSIDEPTCESIFGDKPGKKVVQFARMAREAGIRGVVCAPNEAALLRNDAVCADMTIVTPGVRPLWSEPNDQNPDRIMTPGKAIMAGADYVVIGRPIKNGADYVGSRVKAAKLIDEEIEAALAELG